MKDGNPSCHGCYPSPQEQENERHPVSRRKFVSTMGVATAALLAAACSKDGNPFADSSGPSRQPTTPPRGSRIGEAGDLSAKVAVNSVNNYDPYTLKANIQAAIEALGGLADILPSGGTVGIKLNMTGGASSAKNAERKFKVAATELFWTHPAVLQAVGELFKDAGAGRIIVVEAIYDRESYTRWGYDDVVNYLGAEFYDINKKAPYSDFLEVTVPNPLTYRDTLVQNGILHDLDCFISLPKVKRHYGAGVTNAMKNMIGSTPLSVYQKSGAWREKLHTSADGSKANNYAGYKSLVRTIVDLNKIRPIHFAVCDAIMTADNGEGPWNQGFEPIAYDTLVASKDPVAADAVGTSLMGWDPMAADKDGPFANSSLPGSWAGTDNYLRIAEEEGLGYHDLSKIEVIDATVNTRVEQHG